MLNNSNSSQGVVRVKNKKVGTGLFFAVIIFFCATFTFLTYAFFIGQVNFLIKSSPSEGIVVSFSETTGEKRSVTYSPVVEYSDSEGVTRTFTSRLGSSRTSYSICQKVKILIPQDGSEPQINSFLQLWFGGIIVSIFAIIIWLILIFSIRTAIRNKRMRKLLGENGEIISANVTSVYENTSGKNATLSWCIQAQWLNPRDNKMYTFESEDIIYNPKDFVGNEINVKILPQNPKIYEMDISKLPVPGN